MPTNELAVQNFKNLLNDKSVRAQVKNSLKENSGAFMSSMLDLYSNDNLLQNCDAQAVVSECMKAAALNLPIVKSLGFAYIIPYKGKPTFTIGYKGLIQLAQRSGQYKTINADVVYEGEFRGKNKLSGEIDLTGERTGDEVVGYFAYFKTINGFEKTLYMSKEEIENWRNKYSKSSNSNYSSWSTEFDKMALKTVLRRLISTYGIMTADLQTAVISDNSVEKQVQQEVNENANKVNVNVDTGEVVENVIDITDDVTPIVEEDDLP